MYTQNNTGNFQDPKLACQEIGRDPKVTCQEIGQDPKVTCQEIGRDHNNGQSSPYPPDPAYPTGSTKVLYDGIYSFLCPHCNLVVAVEKNEVNCRIFRHGNYITQRDSSGRAIGYGDSINPHAPKEVCDELVSRDLIIGCGKPLQMYVSSESYISSESYTSSESYISSEGQYYVRVCDYI